MQTTQLQKKIVDSISAVTGCKTAAKYYNFAEGELNKLHDKAVEATILTNFQRVMDSDLGQQMSMMKDYGPYVMEVWPVVTAWYPEFPLKDLISVQDMDKPLAYLFFSKLLEGTDKAPSAAGNVVETPLGMRRIRGYYPTGEIHGEEIEIDATDNWDGDLKSTVAALAYFPMNTAADYLSKVRVGVTGGTLAGIYTADAIVNGKIILKKAGAEADSNNYIDIQTGAIVFKESGSAPTITKLTVNYVWNIEYANDVDIPQVKEEIEMLPMEATPRALQMKWTIFSEYLKKSQFGIDIREDNTKRILSLLYQYQLRYILDTMYDYAEGAPATVTIPSATTMSVEVKVQEVLKDLKNIATRIELASGRIEGNRIVCGRNFKSFVESLPNTLFERTAHPGGFSGPREIGTLSTFKVYYDPYRADNEAFMTYRGDEWYDAAYYLGIFMPIVPTDAIALGVKIRESFCSMEAHKYHKPSCVAKITVEFDA